MQWNMVFRKRKGLNETEISNFFYSLPKLVRPDYMRLDNKKALELMTSSDVTIEDIMYDVSFRMKNIT